MREEIGHKCKSPFIKCINCYTISTLCYKVLVDCDQIMHTVSRIMDPLKYFVSFQAN